MDASQTCDQVLQFIKKSNLNYFLPVSATALGSAILHAYCSGLGACHPDVWLS